MDLKAIPPLVTRAVSHLRETLHNWHYALSHPVLRPPALMLASHAWQRMAEQERENLVATIRQLDLDALDSFRVLAIVGIEMSNLDGLAKAREVDEILLQAEDRKRVSAAVMHYFLQRDRGASE
ncbi:MAG: hypothetical protein HYV08_00140 [Deltaproteobacteria bacterium]|nr:hypothetical protein [Deltaproteobacteria bacterium]MBI3076960.1 hypothetical protein [Deltaproteobacteria bacterium]